MQELILLKFLFKFSVEFIKNFVEEKLNFPT